MDVISNLPDSILSHILSLLPTKLAASTCVLSKRWQFLWTMLHNLDLVCNTDQLQKDQVGRTVTSFVNFVNKFFNEHDKDLCIKRFRLQFGSSCSSTDVDSWVLAAIASDVEKLDLELCLPYSFERCRIGGSFLFRCGIHTCKTLVVLKLNCIVVDAPPSSIHFPSLKILRLYEINFENQDSFSNLFYGCPVLEKLDLGEASDFEDFGGYVISSPTLRELVMSFSGEGGSTCLWLEAPSLEYLNVDIILSRDVYLKDLDNLVQAVVSLHLNDHSLEADVLLHMVEHAFAALHNVQILKMREFTIQAICDASFDNLPLFRNLIQLEIDEFCCFWQMLLSLLRKLPYLQHLTLNLFCCSTCGDFLGLEAWVELDVLNCLSHLRTLCFYDAFGWDDDNDHSRDDMGFLTYVLKNSVVLENVTITYERGTITSNLKPLTSNLKRVVKQRLASLERVSKKCQLQFEGEVL